MPRTAAPTAACAQIRASSRAGIRALGRFLHRRGLLLGVYESPGAQTCAQVNGLYEGSTRSLRHERQDARTFAPWAADYVTYDYCSRAVTRHDRLLAFTQMREPRRATRRH